MNTQYKIGTELKLHNGTKALYLDTFTVYNVCTTPRAWSIHVGGVEVMPETYYKVVIDGKIGIRPCGQFNESYTFWAGNRIYPKHEAEARDDDFGPWLPGMEELIEQEEALRKSS
jgi:hypothetical protein